MVLRRAPPWHSPFPINDIFSFAFFPIHLFFNSSSVVSTAPECLLVSRPHMPHRTSSLVGLMVPYRIYRGALPQQQRYGLNCARKFEM
jgi:hypothetical protein